MAKNDLRFCEWKTFRRQTEIGEVLWHRAEARLLSENFPHCIQCVLMLAMAVERFILICYPARAKQLLRPKRRKGFYVAILLLLSCLGVMFAAAYRNGIVLTETFKDYSEDNSLHQALDVGNLFFLTFL